MSVSRTVRILRSVPGFDNRVNDVVFLSGEEPTQGSVVFFPGDVQDLEELQAEHRDNRRYLEWSLEKTTQLLGRSFPRHNIFTVRPAKKTLKTFSCFENFVESCDGIGSPKHTPDNKAIPHLLQLLQNTLQQLQAAPENQAVDKESVNELTVIGFSKGVVVLNQFLHELCTLSTTGPRPSLPFRRFIWLDGGHNGGPGTSVTDRNVVRGFSEFGIRVCVRVTPYQVEDQRRPWIQKEERQFYKLLREFSVDVDRKCYFEDKEASIEVHFDIIRTLETDPVKPL